MHRIGEEVRDPEYRAVLVTDDFHQIKSAKGTPRKDKKAKDDEVAAKKSIHASLRRTTSPTRLGENGSDIPERYTAVGRVLQGVLSGDKTEISRKNIGDVAPIFDLGMNPTQLGTIQLRWET